MKFIFISACLLLLSLSFLSTGAALAQTERVRKQTKKSQIHTRSQVMMGDIPVSIQICAPASSKQKVWAVMDRAFALARSIEQEVSEFHQGSQTHQLNLLAGLKAVGVGERLFHLLKNSIRFSKLTDGFFDMTYASIDEQATYRVVKLNESKRLAFIKTIGARVGLSGIAKGYIVDQMAHVLQTNSYPSFLINAGGDLRIGNQCNKKNWVIGIQDPFQAKKVSCQLNIREISVASSGIYVGGKHWINPMTRERTTRPYSSVTILAPNTEYADAAATALFVAADKAEAIFKKLKDENLVYSAFMIDLESKGTMWGTHKCHVGATGRSPLKRK
jgi:FAD:protein FMN transferase